MNPVVINEQARDRRIQSAEEGLEQQQQKAAQEANPQKIAEEAAAKRQPELKD